MTDDEKQPMDMKDERDLIIEDLKGRLDRIETEYSKKIGEYQRANSELWARLHPVTKEPEAVPDDTPTWDVNKAVDAYHAAMGIKKE